MKLIQHFKDVYDYMFFINGQDPKVVWDRKSKQVENRLNPSHRVLEDRSGEVFAQILIINQTVLVKQVDKNGHPVKLDSKKSKWWDYGNSKVEYLDSLKEYPDIYNAPVILVGYHLNNQGYYARGVFINPCLNHTGLEGRIYPAISVFQDVDPVMMYTEINAWFGRHASEPKMVELSNKDKLEKHGFDSKISFRGKQ